MRTIVLDTDFIIKVLEWKIDLKEELNRICNFNFEIAVLDKTFEELENKKLGKLATEFISSFRTIKTAMDRPVDELLLSLKNDAIIATQDKKLKEKLKKGKFPVITIRQRKFLMIQDVL